MLKFKLSRRTAAMLSITLWLAIGFVLDPLIGIWYLPAAFLITTVVVAVAFGHWPSTAANLLFFLLAVPYAITKTTNLSGGAAVGLFAAVIVVVIGLVAWSVVPGISPIVSLFMRTRLRQMAAGVGTHPSRVDEATRAALLSIESFTKDPFRFPVVKLPRRQIPMTFTISRDLDDLWLAPVPTAVPGGAVDYIYWPDGLPGDMRRPRGNHTPITERVSITRGEVAVARRLLTLQLQQAMQQGVTYVRVHEHGIIVRFRDDATPETFATQAESACRTAASVIAAVAGLPPSTDSAP